MDPKTTQNDTSDSDLHEEEELQKKIREIDSRLAAFQSISQSHQDQEGKKQGLLNNTHPLNR